MKIYFEDGQLIPYSPDTSHCEFRIDAANGTSFCENRLETALRFYPNCTIYTNSLLALNNKYVWDDKNKVPELYVRDSKTVKFERIDRLTDKEIRKAHNLMQMYINGAFDNYVAYPIS